MSYKKKLSLVDLAWGIIANVNNGDWSQQSKEWLESANKWRDEYIVSKQTRPQGYIVSKQTRPRGKK